MVDCVLEVKAETNLSSNLCLSGYIVTATEMKPERHVTYQLTMSQSIERIPNVPHLTGAALEEGKRSVILL